MSNTIERLDVLIAGGSFVGLSLALALSRSSNGALRVAVADRTPPDIARSAQGDGRATALSAASRHLFEALGVWTQVSRHAQPITGIDITDSQLQTAVRQPLLHFDGGLQDGEDAAVMVENHVLRDALMAQAMEAAGVTFLAPETVTGFTAAISGADVQLESAGAVRCALLVAADGKRSALRRMAGIKTIGWSYPQAGIVATLGVEKPHGGKAIQHFLPAGPFAVLPLTENRVSLVWTERCEDARKIVGLGDAKFLLEAKRRMGRRHGRLSLAGPRASFPLDIHLARAFAGKRFALAGDAAHSIHPLAGQGLNIGLRDVAALAEVVIEAARLGLDPGSDAALKDYERWRRFDSAFSALAMDGLNRLFSNDNVPLRALRSVGLGLVDRSAPLKRFFVREAAGLTGTVPRLLKGEAI